MWAYSYVIYRRRAFECVPEVVFILFLREGKNIPLQNFYKIFRLKTVIEIWDNGTLLHRQWDALWPCPWSPLPVLGIEDFWDHSPHRQPWVPLSTTQATALGSISSLRLHPRWILPADFTWEPRVGRDDNQQSISPANRPTWEHLALGRRTRSFHLALRSEGVERVSISYSKYGESRTAHCFLKASSSLVYTLAVEIMHSFTIFCYPSSCKVTVSTRITKTVLRTAFIFASTSHDSGLIQRESILDGWDGCFPFILSSVSQDVWLDSKCCF